MCNCCYSKPKGFIANRIRTMVAYSKMLTLWDVWIHEIELLYLQERVSLKSSWYLCKSALVEYQNKSFSQCNHEEKSYFR